MTTTTWFITGASSGFGIAFASFALGRGYNVVATARSIDNLGAFAAPAPNRVLVHKLDVTAPGEAQQAIAASIRRFGRIDVIINNVGFGIIGAVEETPETEFRAQMETNFFGALAVIQAALPHLRAQQSGAIVNISSFAGPAVGRRPRRLLGLEVRPRGHVRGAGARARAVRDQGANRPARRLPHQCRCRAQIYAGTGGLPGHRRWSARFAAEQA